MDKRKIFNEMLLEAIEEGAPITGVDYDLKGNNATVSLRLWSPLENLVLAVPRLYDLNMVNREGFFNNFLYDMRYWTGRLRAQVKSPDAHYISKDGS